MLFTSIDPGTVQAYRETEYQARGNPQLTLRVGQASAALLAAHRWHNADCSAFVTACNPFSQRLSDATNAARQESLGSELSRLGLAFLPGVGEHPSDKWPGEASFLVFGLTLDAAKALGNRFDQNAIIWSGTDAVPQLILLR